MSQRIPSDHLVRAGRRDQAGHNVMDEMGKVLPQKPVFGLFLLARKTEEVELVVRWILRAVDSLDPVVVQFENTVLCLLRRLG